MGPESAGGDVRARGVLRRTVWRIPELRAGFICGDNPSRRGGAVVRPVLHYRQGGYFARSRSSRERAPPLIPAGTQSSSFIGPLVVGLVADLTGNIRYSFLFLVAMLWAAIPVLAGVDVDRGRADAHAWSSDDDDRSGHGTDGDPVVRQDRNQPYQMG